MAHLREVAGVFLKVGARVMRARALVVVALSLIGTALLDGAAARVVPRPGALVSATPAVAPEGARAWRVTYHSRAVDGRDVVVSGVVVAPTGRAPRAGRPIVTWAHGTTGLADQCAPSRSANVVVELPWLRALLERDVVVVATDYEGLGTPGPHPYLVGASEGRSVLDIARAARRLPAAHAGRVVIAAGHSQGGHAALFAGELAPVYAPELDVRGVAALAPVTDLTTLFPPVAPADGRGFGAMVLDGIRVAYPDADAAAVMTPETTATLTRADDRACLTGTLSAFADPAVPLFGADPSTVPSVAAALRRSTPGRTATPVPIAVFQGTDDAIVPAGATAEYVERACALGDDVWSDVAEGVGHGDVPTASSASLLSWLDGRLAGDQAPTTC
jgi:hypothetical protein